MFDGNFDGQFTQFGPDRYALLPEAEYLKVLEKKAHFDRPRLNNPIPIGKQFYELRFETTADGAQPARAVLKKSETPLGKIELQIEGGNGVKAEIDGVFWDKRENGVFFRLSGAAGEQQKLPIGSYQLGGGAIRYGSAAPGEWQVGFEKGSNVTVSAETPCILKLGSPKLTPTVMKEQDRGRPEAARETAFKEGDTLYCLPETVGVDGERYRRFYTSSAGKTPTFQAHILDAKGNEVLSPSMQHGADGSDGFSWKTSDVEPGNYTVIMTQETGSLAGKLEGKMEITIE